MNVIEKLARELCRKFWRNPDDLIPCGLGCPEMMPRWRLYQEEARNLLALVGPPKD